MSKTMFVKKGTSFIVTNDVNVDIRNELPVGTYLVKQLPQEGPLYFDQINHY